MGYEAMRKTVVLLASVALAVLLASGVAWATAGQLDPTFGGDGMVVTRFGFKQQQFDALVRQPDGKIVASGYNSRKGTVMARYNQDGSLDDSFGTAGKVIVKNPYTSISDIE